MNNLYILTTVNQLDLDMQIFGYAFHSLTDSCLVNLIDVTLACEDGNSKLVEVVAVADVDSEKVLTIVWCRFDQDLF